MILLDTHALIWIDRRHRRARPLTAVRDRLAISPATLMELQMLADIGRLRSTSDLVGAVVRDERWVVDEPPATAWFTTAAGIPWTRDPFDRLIVAHARLRGWRLATSDALLLQRLTPTERLEL